MKNITSYTGQTMLCGPIDVENDIRKYAPTSIEAEYVVSKDGNLQPNPKFRFAFSKCFGCFNVCGVRCSIDKETDRVVRICGNPYALTNNAGDPFPMTMPPRKAMEALSLATGAPQQNRATLCGRGNAVIDAFEDKHRVLQCLKRVGKRGENQWKTIPYEVMLREIVEGGDLFGEGHVDGLRAIYNDNNPASKRYPEFGPGKNRLFVGTNSEENVRSDFFKRFYKRAWGTPNVGNKNSYCGHQQVAGCALGCFDSVSAGALPMTDYSECEFAIFIGTNPGMSGIGLNTGSRRLANARTDRKNFHYVVVDPILRALSSSSTPGQATWLPIRPAGDTALLFGMLRTIINEKRFNKTFLENPSQEAASKAGEVNYTNATYLVVKTEGDALYNQFLTADAMGFAKEPGKNDEKVVIRASDKKPVGSTIAEPAELFFEGDLVTKDGRKLHVVSAMKLLQQRVNERTMQQYAEQSGIAVEEIEKLAREFTSHGRRVSIETNTACNATDGGIFGYAMIMLGTMVGAHNAKGGMYHTCGAGVDDVFDIYEGPYKLNDFPQASETGILAERDGDYEKSTEYRERVARGENPYPASQPWCDTFIQRNSGEQLVAHANADPFEFKCWITWANNPLYNCSGLGGQKAILDSIKDPKRLGLIIGIDPYVNETNVYADYLVPDLLQYEEWALSRMWGSELMGSVACVPVVEPRTVKNREGRHVCMEQFVIDVSKMLGLPGFGKNAFKDKNGRARSIDVPEDFYVPLFANAAMAGTPLPSPTKDDVFFTNVDRIAPLFKQRLTPEEFGPTLFMLTRGGRFIDVDKRYDGDFFIPDLRMDTQFQVYNESLARLKDSYSGEHLDGQPTCDYDRFWDGSYVKDHWSSKDYPFAFSTFKSQLRSPYSAVLPRVTALEPHNFIQMHEDDAARLGIKTGDRARVETPLGTSIEGVVQADKTVVRGAVLVPTGYGHTQFGASTMVVDGREIPGDRRRGGGMPVNEFNIVDPTRHGASLYRDRVFGATARHGVPVRVVKVA